MPSPRSASPLILLTTLALAMSLPAAQQPDPPAPDGPLPDALTLLSGSKVTTAEQWQQTRRAEVLELFRTNIYGRAPVGRPADLAFKVTNVDPNAMEGKATLKEVAISFSGPNGAATIHLTVFTPNARKPAPAFLLICNRRHENIDPTRKEKMPFWPAEEIIARGYAAAAFLNSDLAPDEKDAWTHGVHKIFDPAERTPDAWGTIAAWAWGASRCLDYLVTDPEIDAMRVAVIGHSRAGKTALWAGAEDERFAYVISNDSGCTGAAVARGKTGERVKRINQSFPHWFCENYKKYNEKEDTLPIDQHELVALAAPRLVYVASASEDAWANPAKEFQGALEAASVYELFGLPTLRGKSLPAPGEGYGEGQIGYHLRPGKHDLEPYDWQRYMDFADRHGWKN